jgi:IclR family transcriptional regulator, KDG regulon repressor
VDRAVTDGASESDRVAQTLRALELFAGEPASHFELAQRLGVHPRTARRLASRLETEGYLTSVDSGKRYAVTMKLVALAGKIVERTPLVQIALPYVVALRNRTEEASHFCVPRAEGAMHLIQESGHNAVMVRSQVGDLAPYPRTAVGKALLAHMPDQLEIQLRSEPYATAAQGGDSRERLLAELEQVREAGWACDDRENDPDLRCVAAPAFDHTGAVAGALGISAPVSRLQAESFEEIGATVRELADALSQALGREPGAKPA